MHRGSDVQKGVGAETFGVGGREAGNSGMVMGDSQVGRVPVCVR